MDEHTNLHYIEILDSYQQLKYQPITMYVANILSYTFRYAVYDIPYNISMIFANISDNTKMMLLIIPNSDSDTVSNFRVVSYRSYHRMGRDLYMT